MLWICIHLPHLPLEALARGAPTPEPLAIAEAQRILVVDARARHRGVRPGMALPAATAIAPQLRVLPRDPATETEALLGVASWASRFTPSVALELPDALLLEVEGSLRLFGDAPAIGERLRHGAAEMGFAALVACAPTARAASWLARAGEEACVVANDSLAARLGPLPLRVTGCDANTLESLAAIGAGTIGDLLALPRDGLARRFGQALLDRLDQALGRLADPRTFYVPPPTFRATIELAAEVTQAEALLFAAHRLLVQLEGYLAARAGGVPRFVLRFVHREGRASEIIVGLVTPNRDADHLTTILRERLGRHALAEPARAITLVAEEIVPLAGETIGLFHDMSPASEDWAKLVERLRARLGTDAVHGIATAADHRPERAWRIAELVVRSSSGRGPGARHGPVTQKPSPPSRSPAAGSVMRSQRPFWLLAEPRPLAEVGAVPHHGGPLALLAGPERIETGWWDGAPCTRDYYVAQTSDRGLVWVYREPAGWYLHGLFA
ncbi:MAG: DNA polymerase Y family protein [Burkholderiales bacterium]